MKITHKTDTRSNYQSSDMSMYLRSHQTPLLKHTTVRTVWNLDALSESMALREEAVWAGSMLLGVL